jgi:energy-coupling factor transporter ATP-binding protein EcfA2
MTQIYTATAKRNPGRKGYVITFRHPLKMEGSKPGRKVFKGLGTDDVVTARHLEARMNALLARPDLHSVGSRADALREGFEPAIVEIFYGDLDPSATSHRTLRNRLLPLPAMGPGHAARTLILGNSGVGKTTLLRRLIGSDPVRDRFPATSTNRTTTCEIEIVTGSEDYSAAVTFLSRHQVQQEVTESLSNAVLKAIESATDEIVMKDFLDDTDQRFRLKYVLGGWTPPTSKASASSSFGGSSKRGSTAGAPENSPFLKEVLASIREIAANARNEVEAILGKLEHLRDEERNYALDEMQRAGECSEQCQDTVSAVIEAIEERFAQLLEGKFNKSSTGWPEAWTWSAQASERGNFLKAVRWFCANNREEWGALLTPLVTGIRVAGPFRPDWIAEREPYAHVFVDTQGLDHEKPTTELSSEVTSVFGQVHNILFVESGKDSLKSQTARKVMEAIAGAGYTASTTVVLTHMDLVVGDDIPTDEDRKDKAFSGLRSLVANEVSQNVSRDSGRQMATHLANNTFYLGYLDGKKYPEGWDDDDRAAFEEHLGHDLRQLTEHLVLKANPQLLQPGVPQYSFESLGLAVRESSVAFQEVWEARLGYKRIEGISSVKWQSIKAMSRRHAEGWFDGYWLRPVDTLISLTRNVLSRFLEVPLLWLPEHKRMAAEEKAAIIDRLKQLVNDELTEMSKARLWKRPQTRWQGAYEPSGTGSTVVRKQRVHELFLTQVPIPQSISDRLAQAWVDEVKQVVQRALAVLEEEASNARPDA